MGFEIDSYFQSVARMIGPAAPSPDMLVAAAKLTEAQAALRYYTLYSLFAQCETSVMLTSTRQFCVNTPTDFREAEEELSRDPLVGPAPAAAVAEAEFANEAERFEEVSNQCRSDFCSGIAARSITFSLMFCLCALIHS